MKKNEKKKSYEKIFRILIYGEIFQRSGFLPPPPHERLARPHKEPQTLIYLLNLIACFLKAKRNRKTCLNCFQLFFFFDETKLFFPQNHCLFHSFISLRKLNITLNGNFSSFSHLRDYDSYMSFSLK